MVDEGVEYLIARREELSRSPARKLSRPWRCANRPRLFRREHLTYRGCHQFGLLELNVVTAVLGHNQLAFTRYGRQNFMIHPVILFNRFSVGPRPVGYSAGQDNER